MVFHHQRMNASSLFRLLGKQKSNDAEQHTGNGFTRTVTRQTLSELHSPRHAKMIITVRWPNLANYITSEMKAAI